MTLICAGSATVYLAIRLAHSDKIVKQYYPSNHKINPQDATLPILSKKMAAIRPLSRNAAIS
jgi:hypothetical protein